ncbi:MAG TPA: exodeoxyribonuclease V subunit alpha [Acidimicrobiia bacterium]|nr:exodeoxyribonuclease V subunit alpha [Acidimicrobiia bacterium]
MSASSPLLSRDTAALAAFVVAGVLDASAVHVADVIARAVGGIEPEVLLAAALAARAPRFGHICVVPAEVARSIVVDDAQLPAIDSLAWPDPAHWAALLSASPAVRGPDDPTGDVNLPLVWDGTRLYLERYWRFEQRVADDLLRRAGTAGGFITASPELDAVLDELFGADDPLSPDRQREAAARALTRRIAVVAGGPGTGKTRMIARLLAAAHRVALGRGQALEVALTAPTGKASARVTEAVHREVETASLTEDVAGALRAAEATTLHRLLGAGAGGRFRHDRSDPLPYDMVVVDEASMVSLPLMARLLDAVRPDATLVLVGDPSQLASVEAGAVLGEIVGTPTMRATGGPLAADVVLLERVHRFGVDSAIAALADAIRAGDADRALDLLRDDQTGELTWVDGEDEVGIDGLRAEVAAGAVDVIRAAHAGDAETGLRHASDLKVLCATRLGRLGVYQWSDGVEALAARALPDAGIGRRAYVGRLVSVTKNDYINRLFNGDVGLVVAGAHGPVVAFADPSGIRELAMSQLGDVETWWAMTIHKSQGSEFRRVIVALPPPPSPILTRELLYTAVTRAKEQVTLVATESSLRAAIARPVARASGLGPKLWP